MIASTLLMLVMLKMLIEMQPWLHPECTLHLLKLLTLHVNNDHVLQSEHSWHHGVHFIKSLFKIISPNNACVGGAQGPKVLGSQGPWDPGAKGPRGPRAQGPQGPKVPGASARQISMIKI